jgi:hypothetical protein
VNAGIATLSRNLGSKAVSSAVRAERRRHRLRLRALLGGVPHARAQWRESHPTSRRGPSAWSRGPRSATRRSSPRRSRPRRGIRRRGRAPPTVPASPPIAAPSKVEPERSGIAHVERARRVGLAVARLGAERGAVARRRNARDPARVARRRSRRSSSSWSWPCTTTSVFAARSLPATYQGSPRPRAVRRSPGPGAGRWCST